jgi:inhibitor of cysteine peptidase
MHTRKLRSFTLWLLALSLLSSACAELPGAQLTPTPAGPIQGLALVESVELLMLESFPVQVRAVVKGSLPDGCTTIDRITQTRRDNTFEIEITTQRPADAVCTLALVSFEETIPLDVADLKAGVYLVVVNGVSNSFELSTDNVLAPTPGADASGVITGRAFVESVELLMLESFPVQVHAVVKGSLSDGCTTVDQVTQTRQGNTFEIQITTRRPAEAMCTQALVPFEETIALDVVGLKAGVYVVNVNDVSSSFELSADNAPPATP